MKYYHIPFTNKKIARYGIGRISLVLTLISVITLLLAAFLSTYNVFILSAGFTTFFVITTVVFASLTAVFKIN